MRVYCSFIALAVSIAFPLFSNTVQLLKSLQDSCWSSYRQEHPEVATFAGCAGDHGRWSDYSVESMQHRAKAIDKFLLELEKIPRETLSNQYQVQYDILDWILHTEKEGFFFPFEYLGLTHLDGIHHSVPYFLQIVTEKCDAGYEALISRMDAVPLLVDQQIALLQKGIDTGIVIPKSVMRLVPSQLRTQISSTPEDSVFFNAFADVDDGILRARALTTIKNNVYPAFAKLCAFVENVYIPACRTTIGFCDLPNGREAYAYLVKTHTTTDLIPAEIHQIGMSEVARIQDEMRKIVFSTGFEGSIFEFAAALESNPDCYYETKEELLQGFRDLLTKIHATLPILFNKIPVLPCEVVSVPDYSEASSVMAYYFPGSVETRRSGRFFVSTSNLKEFPKWSMEALALHEALPGHHFQISLAQCADIPMIQKYNFTTAFVEGWGLYSESLGYELGFYQDPRSSFGRLVYEMLRAVRLVVDTGIHEYGWNRDTAISYCKQYLPVAESEIINEVDRYIVMPAQALAYKIGEIKLKSLREEVKEIEGVSFDIRSFHDSLLQLGGCLPLTVLDHYFQQKLEAEGV